MWNFIYFISSCNTHSVSFIQTIIRISFAIFRAVSCDLIFRCWDDFFTLKVHANKAESYGHLRTCNRKEHVLQMWSKGQGIRTYLRSDFTTFPTRAPAKISDVHANVAATISIQRKNSWFLSSWTTEATLPRTYSADGSCSKNDRKKDQKWD